MKTYADIIKSASASWSDAWSDTEQKIHEWIGRDKARASIEAEIKRLLGPVVEAAIEKGIKNHHAQITIKHNLMSMAGDSWNSSAPHVQKAFPAHHVKIAMKLVLKELGYTVNSDEIVIEIDMEDLRPSSSPKSAPSPKKKEAKKAKAAPKKKEASTTSKKKARRPGA